MTLTPDTIFGKIIRREIPANIVYEDELALAFTDVNPQAPTHILVIPKKPIVNLATAQAEDQLLLGHLLLTVQKVAQIAGLEQGYRVVMNTGQDGGQTVYHLHIHILGGRSLSWPPGWKDPKSPSQSGGREAQLFVGWVSGSLTCAGVGFHTSTQPTFILYLIPPAHLVGLINLNEHGNLANK